MASIDRHDGNEIAAEPTAARKPWAAPQLFTGNPALAEAKFVSTGPDYMYQGNTYGSS